MVADPHAEPRLPLLTCGFSHGHPGGAGSHGLLFGVGFLSWEARG